MCTNEVPALATLTTPNGRNQNQKSHFFSAAPPRPGSCYRNIRIDASLYHADHASCISCITQNTSHPQLSQYLRSAIHKPQKYLFTTLWLFSWNSYIPNQTGISEIFRAHSLRRLLVVPRLVWGESVSVRGKRERRESETLVFKTGWM